MKKILLIGGVLLGLGILPKTSLAATLYFSPSSGSYGVGSTFSVSVRANTDTAANTAEANVTYSTDTLELVSVKQGTTFYLPAPNSPSKTSVGAYFGGGLPSPGYTGSGGVLGAMTFRAKAIGSPTVSVGSGHVLLNDGNGTDALTGTSSAHFTITPPPVGGPVVTSSTHPNPDSWYSNSNVDLSWSRPDNAYGFSFILDQSPDTVPDDTLDTTITTTKSYTNQADGVYYFHIKAKGQNTGFGATTDFKIQIDTVAPEKFDIEKTAESTISFDTKDDLSGLDHYDVYADGKLIKGNASSPYSFTDLNSGDHVVKVAAYDKAGNERDAIITLTITTTVGAVKNLSIPVYGLLIINFLMLLLILILLWLLFRRKKKSRSDEVADIQADIDESLEELKKKIAGRLEGLAAKSNRELYDKEEKVAEEVKDTVTKTRKRIDGKIQKLRKKVSKQNDNDKILE